MCIILVDLHKSIVERKYYPLFIDEQMEAVLSLFQGHTAVLLLLKYAKTNKSKHACC